MEGLQDLPKIFESETIKPSFKMVHVITALIIFNDEENADGIGRYRLKKELNLSEGKVKSLLGRLKGLNLIETNSRVKGHVITEKGQEIVKELEKSITIPKIPEFDYSDVSIGENGYYCVVKQSAERITSGMAQRDEAIIIGASGATCLIFNGNEFRFPNDSENIQTGISASKIDERLENNDVLVIGTGDTSYLARLGTLAASLSLLNLF